MEIKQSIQCQKLERMMKIHKEIRKNVKWYADLHCGGYMELLYYEYEENDKLEIKGSIFLCLEKNFGKDLLRRITLSNDMIRNGLWSTRDLVAHFVVAMRYQQNIYLKKVKAIKYPAESS